MARVLVVGPTSEPWVAIAAEVDEDLARLRRPDVELTYRCTGAGPASIRSEDDVAAAAPFVVQAVIDAAAEGFDAVIVDCTSDPGVDAARRMVTIPVIGPGEAMRDAIDRALPPVCVLSGDDLRSLDATTLGERTADAGSVAFGGTGFSHVAERLRAERPDRPVLDPLHVALDAAVTALTAREHRFTATDYLELSRLIIEHWSSALDRDWSVGAGEVEWSCWKTAEHVVDCEFSYALFLASRCEADYPKFGELDALPDAQPVDLVDGLRAVTTMLHAVIVTAEPGARAIIRRRPAPMTGSAEDFAARGAHEMVLHAHDITSGLGVPFEPPADLTRRLLWSTLEWPVFDRIEPSGDAWSDLLERSGRARISR
jgi:Asp/Glu/hydantoin racemase